MVPPHKVVVRLTSSERRALRRFVGAGTHPAALVRRAHILLKTDADGPHARGGQVEVVVEVGAFRQAFPFPALPGRRPRPGHGDRGMVHGFVPHRLQPSLSVCHGVPASPRVHLQQVARLLERRMDLVFVDPDQGGGQAVFVVIHSNTTRPPWTKPSVAVGIQVIAYDLFDLPLLILVCPSCTFPKTNFTIGRYS